MGGVYSTAHIWPHDSSFFVSLYYQCIKQQLMPTTYLTTEQLDQPIITLKNLKDLFLDTVVVSKPNFKMILKIYASSNFLFKQYSSPPPSLCDFCHHAHSLASNFML